MPGVKPGIHTTGDGREREEKLIDAHSLIFRKTTFAPTIVARLAIIWLSSIPSCYVLGADSNFRTLQLRKVHELFWFTDKQICSFLHVSLYFSYTLEIRGWEKEFFCCCWFARIVLLVSW